MGGYDKDLLYMYLISKNKSNKIKKSHVTFWSIAIVSYNRILANVNPCNLFLGANGFLSMPMYEYLIIKCAMATFSISVNDNYIVFSVTK